MRIVVVVVFFSLHFAISSDGNLALKIISHPPCSCCERIISLCKFRLRNFFCSRKYWLKLQNVKWISFLRIKKNIFKIWYEYYWRISAMHIERSKLFCISIVFMSLVFCSFSLCILSMPSQTFSSFFSCSCSR